MVSGKSSVEMLGIIADALGVEISAFVTQDNRVLYVPEAAPLPSHPEMLSRLTSAFQALPSDDDRHRALLWMEALARSDLATGL